MFLTWFFISTTFLIERDLTWLLLDNTYSKSIWRESLGQWVWPGCDEVGPKSVPGIFTFSEIHGFHFKSQKPWSDGKPDCCKLIPVYYNFWFYKKDNNKIVFWTSVLSPHTTLNYHSTNGGNSLYVWITNYFCN